MSQFIETPTYREFVTQFESGPSVLDLTDTPIRRKDINTDNKGFKPNQRYTNHLPDGHDTEVGTALVYEDGTYGGNHMPRYSEVLLDLQNICGAGGLVSSATLADGRPQTVYQLPHAVRTRREVTAWFGYGGKVWLLQQGAIMSWSVESERSGETGGNKEFHFNKITPGQNAPNLVAQNERDRVTATGITGSVTLSITPAGGSAASLTIAPGDSTGTIKTNADTALGAGANVTVTGSIPALFGTTAAGSVGTARDGIGAALCPTDGKYYLFGGADGSQAYNTIAVYDIATGIVTAKTATLATALYNIRVVWAPTLSKFVLLGGATAGAASMVNTVATYDPTTDTYAAVGTLPAGRSHGTAVEYNGVVYYLGGDSASATPVTTIYKYNLTSNTSSTLGAVVSYAADCPQTARVGNVIYLLGGASASSAVTNTCAFDLSTETATAKTVIPAARHSGSAVAIGTLIYVLGGSNSTGSTTSTTTIYVYDTVANSWTLSPLVLGAPAYRAGTVVTAAADGVVLFGGRDGAGAFSNVINRVAFTSSGTVDLQFGGAQANKRVVVSKTTGEAGYVLSITQVGQDGTGPSEKTGGYIEPNHWVVYKAATKTELDAIDMGTRTTPASPTQANVVSTATKHSFSLANLVAPYETETRTLNPTGHVSTKPEVKASLTLLVQQNPDGTDWCENVFASDNRGGCGTTPFWLRFAARCGDREFWIDILCARDEAASDDSQDGRAQWQFPLKRIYRKAGSLFFTVIEPAP